MTVDQARLHALTDLIGRTGASSVQIRYSDDEDPVVWFCVALYDPIGRWEMAAGHDSVEALYRLAEQLTDGGTCTHCGHLTGLLNDINTDGLPTVGVCWWTWDPELAVYRRGCEGIAA